MTKDNIKITIEHKKHNAIINLDLKENDTVAVDIDFKPKLNLNKPSILANIVNLIINSLGVDIKDVKH